MVISIRAPSSNRVYSVFIHSTIAVSRTRLKKRASCALRANIFTAVHNPPGAALWRSVETARAMCSNVSTQRSGGDAGFPGGSGTIDLIPDEPTREDNDKS